MLNSHCDTVDFAFFLFTIFNLGVWIDHQSQQIEEIWYLIWFLYSISLRQERVDACKNAKFIQGSNEMRIFT